MARRKRTTLAIACRHRLEAAVADAGAPQLACVASRPQPWMAPVATLPIGHFSLSQIEVIGRRTSSGGAVFIIDVGPRRGGQSGDAQELGRADVAKVSALRSWPSVHPNSPISLPKGRQGGWPVWLAGPRHGAFPPPAGFFTIDPA